MRASLACSLALAACLFASPSARAEDPAPTPQQALVAARADSVVSVKMTLQVSFTIRGTAQENESNQTTTGIVVDSRGLIMLPAELFSPNLNSRMRSMIRTFAVMVALGAYLSSQDDHVDERPGGDDPAGEVRS